MRCCSRLSLWFSSSSFWLLCSSVFPLCRLWISNSLTACAGSGTAFSRTEPSRNWKEKSDTETSAVRQLVAGILSLKMFCSALLSPSLCTAIPSCLCFRVFPVFCHFYRLKALRFLFFLAWSLSHKFSCHPGNKVFPQIRLCHVYTQIRGRAATITSDLSDHQLPK